MARRIDLPTLGGAACAVLALALLWGLGIGHRSAPAGDRTPAADHRGSAGLHAQASAPLPDPHSTSWLGPASAPPQTQEVATCRPDQAAYAAGQVAEVRDRVIHELASRNPGNGDFVVLNGQGYNYGPSAPVDPSILHLDFRHENHEAREAR